jgi:hypothetical protein
VVGAACTAAGESEGAVWWLILAFLLAACAQQVPPPGGPEDKTPPKLLEVRPESGAVNVKLDEVRLRFDNVLNERPQGGATDLDQLVLISPRDGEPRVNWHRSSLSVKPRKEWRPNTAYTVTLLPGLADLRGNVRTEQTTIVFSTGPTIPNTRITGTVYEWTEARTIAGAMVEAASHPDSTVYVTRADTNGHYVLPFLRPGSYTVRGFADANNNRKLDPRESWDTVGVTLRDTLHADVLAFIHDTIGPVISNFSIKDSVTLQVTFDKGIDTAQKVDVSLFTLKAADSSIVPLRSAMPLAEWEKLHPDTTRADTSKARIDTTRAADTTGGRRRAPRAPARGRPPGATPPGRVAPRAGAAPGADTTTQTVTLPKPRPVAEVVIVVARPLTPGSQYRLGARNVRNLLGYRASSDRVFGMPKPSAQPQPPARPAPGDTTRPRPKRPAADTTRRPPR